jgi:NAD(P)-dependent dehydrogenase (short-subunit alcohol dehydrogenase family)
MDLGVKAKKAIITGGTRGIGRAIIEMLGEVNITNREALEQGRTELPRVF